MSRTSSDFSFGKWILGILTSVVAALLVYFLLDKDVGIFRPIPTATPAIPVAPHSAELQIPDTYTAHDELIMTVVLEPGEQKPILMRELWNGPAGSDPACADGVIYMSWMVREPYPGGEDFQVLLQVPQTDNYQVLKDSGPEGSLELGVCYGLTFVNNGLSTYKIEVRYASVE